MATLLFYQSLQAADSEKLIESAYHTELKRNIERLGGKIISVSTSTNTDGILRADFDFDGTPQVLRLIIETKLNETFSSALMRARVLAQVVYYLKKIENLGYELPNIILVGDKDECFVLHYNYLIKYLDKEYDWSIAPSKAGKDNIALVQELTNDSKLQTECYVYMIDKYFDMKEVVSKIIQLVRGVKTQVRLTERNISKIFEYFCLKILRRTQSGKSRYNAREQVELFMLLILDPINCYIHPNKKNTAVFGRKHIAVNGDAFISFTNYYKFSYNAKEKRLFTSIADRLIADSQRRRKGDFYTPTIWVDEANKLLIESLGEDWKQDYVVWDCAWGTGNLTRDYHFKELYCSTLYEHDLALGANYNKNATKFQYDFLNDDVEIFENLRQKVSKGYTLTEHDFWGTQLYIKAPKLIKNMLSRKKILFFINPPFSTTGDMASSRDGRGNKKPGLGDSKISRIMKEWKIGACSQQLYAQFLYRIYQLNAIFNNIVLLGSFTPTLIFTGKHYNWFHRSFNQYNFISGFTFQASEFADVKEGWAISFSIWDFTRSAKTSIKHVIKVISSNGTDSLFYKHSYIVPYNKKLSSFYQSNVKTDKVKDYPTMSTGINITNGLTKHDENCYGYLYMDTPRIEYNDQFVSLIPLRMKGNKTTVALYNDNVLNCLSIFAARRLITNKHATWINCKDEFMKPDISNPLYTQWESDSIVYALFNSSTHFSSLRNVQYNGNYINIYNHFYFMSRDSMKELSLKFNNDNIYYDLQTHATNERLGSKLLNNAALSNEARAVLEFVKQIIRISFKYREQFDDAHPEYHINTWDAGWYQVKGLLKAFMPDYLKKFDELYSILENKMRPLVYELGFLFE